MVKAIWFIMTFLTIAGQILIKNVTVISLRNVTKNYYIVHQV